MASNYASAVRAGTMAAARLHRELDIRSGVELVGGAIDVFGTINELGLPLMLRPLRGLLGAYLSAPCPGVLVTTERPMSIQRFTAAHELGHFRLEHEPSLDDENNILRRSAIAEDSRRGFQETEADAFAVAFMLPKWLILSHCGRQNWKVPNLEWPSTVYQLSLRMGASYEATCRTLERYNLISAATRERLLSMPRRNIKMELLRGYRPQDYRGDVWELTKYDQGTKIDGSRNDLFILQLDEHTSSGYVWDFEELQTSGFAVVSDARDSTDADGIGGPVVRRVTAAPQDAPRGHLEIEERRPWEAENPQAVLSLDFDLTGPEQLGLSRAERRQILEAA